MTSSVLNHVPRAEPSTAPLPFDALLDSEANVACHERPLPSEIATALEKVAAGPLFAVKTTLYADAPDLSEHLEAVSDLRARAFLEADMTAMVRQFAAQLDRRHVQASLAVVTNDACRKYHVDHVTVRLICTYAGPGTEWLRDEDVERKNLARTDVEVDAANRSVLREGGSVRHCRAGDILLLKGERFEGNRGRGAVHRSPPIARQGLRRLVFKIDPKLCC